MNTFEEILRLDEQVIWSVAPDSYADHVIATSSALIAEKCHQLTQESGVRHLPVVVDGRFLGIVSLADLATLVVEEGQL